MSGVDLGRNVSRVPLWNKHHVALFLICSWVQVGGGCKKVLI